MLPFAPPDSGFLPDPLPALPTPLDEDGWPLEAEYARSKHIVPACYARVSPDMQLPSPPADGSTNTKEERKRLVRDGVEALYQSIVDNDMSGGKKGEKILWICLNRYVKRKLDPRKKGITLFCLHANGIVKELWEPTLHRLLRSSASDQVDEIWAWDSLQHGDSGLLNAGNLDSLFHWHDGARDYLNFLVHYLPPTVTSDPLPIHLPRVSADIASHRLTEGFSNSRKLMGVGHSFGGAVSILAALEHPQLFEALVLIDPPMSQPRWFKDETSIQPPHKERRFRDTSDLALGAFGRRGSWKSREEASQLFLQSPFFQRWHPEVFQSYLRNGLYNPSETSPSVKLKTTPLQEANLFSGTVIGAEDAWLRLIKLEERIKLLWVLPGEGENELSGPGQNIVTATRRLKNSSYTRVPGAGHLVTQEKPDSLAKIIQEFLKDTFTGGLGAKL